MVEFALGLFIFALIIAAFTELGPVFLRNLALQSRARADAGDRMIHADSGTGSLSGGGESTIVAATRNGFPSGADFPADPWLYPCTVRPNATGLRDWRNGTVAAAEVGEGLSAESFTLPFLRWFAPDAETDGIISERVVLPPMQGL